MTSANVCFTRMKTAKPIPSGYREEDRFIDPVAVGSGSPHLRFPLPGGRAVRSIRLDPLMTAGKVVIAEAKVTLPQSGLSLDLHHFAPLHEIAKLSFRANSNLLEIETTPGSADSQCEYIFGPVISAEGFSGWRWLLSVLPPTLSMIVIYLVAAAIIGIATGKSPAA